MPIFLNGVDQFLPLSGGTLTGDLTLASGGSIISSGTINLKPSGDADDYFTFATLTNVPTIFGTGAYTRFGDAAFTSKGFTSEDDVLVTGKLEVVGQLYALLGVETGAAWSYLAYLSVSNEFYVADDIALGMGTGRADAEFTYETADADAKILIGVIDESLDSGNNVPVFAWGEDTALTNIDLGLFDEVTQPLITVIEKNGQLHTATNGIADAGAASAVLKHVGGFTAAVVGDIVRITAGTLCTVGWYWITTVTSADQVTLDRNYTSGDTTNVTFVTFHNFPMIGADGVCLKCFDGAPGDANTEIDRDGWLQLDVSQANGRLYWRANNAWHYVDATA